MMPLDGLRVVDAPTIPAGPLCCQIPGGFGAVLRLAPGTGAVLIDELGCGAGQAAPLRERVVAR